MKEIIKTAAEAHFHLTEQDIKSFSELKGRGMRFLTKVYDAEDIAIHKFRPAIRESTGMMECGFRSQTSSGYISSQKRCPV